MPKTKTSTKTKHPAVAKAKVVPAPTSSKARNAPVLDARAPTSSKPRNAPVLPAPAPKADPTREKRDAALLLLPSSYAAAPDLPVEIAAAEIAALYKLGKKESKTLARYGITSKQLEELGALGKELTERQRAWVTERDKAASVDAKKLRGEAEVLKGKMLAAGEWALRHDDGALGELASIREGSGLPDTIEDLYHLANLWTKHAGELAVTKLTRADVERARELAALLAEVASDEVSNVTAARALDLRNRCFWAAAAAAGEIRVGGRYAFSDQPKMAARFASRYRQARNRRHKANGAKAGAPQVAVAKTALS